MESKLVSMAFPAQLQTIEDLTGPAGHLEALLNVGLPTAPYTALICHPHPPSGGTMHTKVVYQAMKALNEFGLPVLRFNFRGTGKSEGKYDNGPGEILDVRAAIDWLDRTFARPILLAGFSFGANIGLQAACNDPRVAGLIGLGLPIQAEGRSYTYEFLEHCIQPKLFVIGAEDPFAPKETIEATVLNLPEPRKLVWIPDAEHFFAGVPGSTQTKLPLMRDEITAWVETIFGLRPIDL